MGLLYEKRGRVAYMTIDRPRTLNSIDPQTFKELSDALIDFRDDRETWVAILTGSGNRAFCVGADIKEMLPVLSEIRNEWWRVPPSLFRGLELWKPIIAAINGHALGGGLELALGCDLRIAADNATFGFPEVTLGIIPGWGGTQRLTRAIPRAKANEMILMAERIDAQEAYRLGLINKVVPSDQLMPAAEQWAQRLCKIPPLAVRAAKEAMYKGFEMNLEEGLRLETKLMDFCTATEDHQEAKLAFLEKREANIKGK
ncbi:MAG: enoyl-CoA hydratase-related protein [Chloroflexi bacterium]|nr:enoyl-CoA hydratase-related protein [Chloroflexota bacterium]